MTMLISLISHVYRQSKKLFAIHNRDWSFDANKQKIVNFTIGDLIGVRISGPKCGNILASSYLLYFLLHVMLWNTL